MEGEEEVLKGTTVKYFDLFPERNYKQGICSLSYIHLFKLIHLCYRISGWSTFSSCWITILSSSERLCHVSKAYRDVSTIVRFYKMMLFRLGTRKNYWVKEYYSLQYNSKLRISYVVWNYIYKNVFVTYNDTWVIRYNEQRKSFE